MRRPSRSATSYPYSLAAIGDDDREQALCIALLLNALTGYYKAARTTSALTHVTVIEEAHRLLRRPRPTGEAEDGNPSARAAEQFANTLAENRKYGEGLIIVEQVPSKLIEDAHKNTALKVMHHLPAQDDRESIAATMNLDERAQQHAQALEPLTAFVTHRRMGGRAALVSIPDVRGAAATARGLDEDPLPGSDVVRERFETFVRDKPRVWQELAPYPGCSGCQHRCQFRGISEAVAESLAPYVGPPLRSDGYPPPGSARDRVWSGVVATVGKKAETYIEYTDGQREDLAACMLMHSLMRFWPGKPVHGLVNKFRSALAMPQ